MCQAMCQGKDHEFQGLEPAWLRASPRAGLARGGGCSPWQHRLLHLAHVPLQLAASLPEVLTPPSQLLARLLQPLVGSHVGPALLVELLALGLRVLRPPGGAWSVWGQDMALWSGRGQEQTHLPLPSKTCDGGGTHSWKGR